MEVLLFFLTALATGVGAQKGYYFSDGYLGVLGGEPARTFTCEGRPYGYYADPANDCRVFHVCLPIQDIAGRTIHTVQYSFFCGNQTIFSQDTLTCSHPDAAYPCDLADGYYDTVNAEFGKVVDRDSQ